MSRTTATALPAGLYPAYRQCSGWNAMLPPRHRTSPPRGTRFGSIVIGAGYTGLAAARRLAELRPDEAVLVLDATSVGEGSAGRNSGFVINVPHNTGMTGHGRATDAAQRQLRLYQAGLQWLEALVRAHRINCGWNPAGKFHAAASAHGVAALKATLALYQAWGVEHTELDADALAARLGTPYYRYGFHATNNVFVQPAALIRGLADSLPPNVVLAENEAVTSLGRTAPFSIATSRGGYVADRVIVANNGFAKSLGLLQDRLITIYTYAALTPVLPPSELAQLGAGPEWGVIPANRLGTTLRRVADGRLMVRSAYSYEHEQTPAATLRLLTDSYRRRYPQMSSHDFEYVWGGTTALTRNGASFFGAIQPGIFAAAGCNGAGVLKGSTYGRLLADLALGEKSPLLADALALEGPSWLPPEPLRRIGVTLAIKYQASVAGAER